MHNSIKQSKLEFKRTMISEWHCKEMILKMLKKVSKDRKTSLRNSNATSEL